MYFEERIYIKLGVVEMYFKERISNWECCIQQRNLQLRAEFRFCKHSPYNAPAARLDVFVYIYVHLCFLFLVFGDMCFDIRLTGSLQGKWRHVFCIWNSLFCISISMYLYPYLYYYVFIFLSICNSICLCI